MMTKKDFIALADLLRKNEPFDRFEPVEWWSMVELLADFCSSQNPRFGRKRWLGYVRGECGPGGGAVRRKR